MIAVGVVTALAATIEPAIVLVVAGCAVAVVIGGLVAGQVAGAGPGAARGRRRCRRRRGAAAALEPRRPPTAGTPWSGVSSTSGYGLGLVDLLRFGTGPFGTGIVRLGLLGTAVAAPARSAAVGAWGGPSGAGCWPRPGSASPGSAGQGWLDGVLPAPDVLLAPAAVGLALAAGLGMAAFEVDLPDYHFGWRQIVSLLAGAAFVLALLPGARQHLVGALGPSPRRLPDARSRSSISRPTPRPPGALARRRQRPAAGRLAPRRPRGRRPRSRPDAWRSPRRRPAPRRSPRSGPAASATRPRPSRPCRSRRPEAPPAWVRCWPRWRSSTSSCPLAPAPDPFARDTTYVPSDLLAVLDGQLDLDSVTVNAGRAGLQERGVRAVPGAAPGRTPPFRRVATPSPTGSSAGSGRRRPCWATSRATRTGPDPSTARPGVRLGRGRRVASEGRRHRGPVQPMPSAGRTATRSNRRVTPRCGSTHR